MLKIIQVLCLIFLIGFIQVIWLWTLTMLPSIPKLLITILFACIFIGQLFLTIKYYHTPMMTNNSVEAVKEVK